MTADVQVTVGAPVAGLKPVEASDTARTVWSATIIATLPGTLTAVLPDGTEVIRQEVSSGENTISWDAASLGQGSHSLTLTLMADGELSAPLTLSFTVSPPSLATDEVYYTPAEMTGVTCDHDQCYWKMSMGDLTDEAAIWQ